jgi:hypothetical protein
MQVPVRIDDPHPAGSSGLTQALLALTYNPAAVSVSAADIHLGSVPASGIGWTLQSRIDAATGQIGIVLFSTTALQRSDGGSLVVIDFHVQPGVIAAPAIQLVTAVNPNCRGEIRTALDDLQGPLTLHPTAVAAPADGGTDVRALQAAAPASAAGSGTGANAVAIDSREPASDRPTLEVPLAPLNAVVFQVEEISPAVVPTAEAQLLDQVFTAYPDAASPADWLRDGTVAEGRAWVLALLEAPGADAPDGLPAALADATDDVALAGIG